MNDIELRSRSRWLAWLVGLVLAILIFAAAVEALAVLRGRLGVEYLALRLAVPFYLWAIWNVRRMIVEVGNGAGHGAGTARLLGRVGIALFLGGLASVFGGPLLHRFISAAGSVALYDVGAITLGVVGAALFVVANLLRQAAAMRAELDEIV